MGTYTALDGYSALASFLLDDTSVHPTQYTNSTCGSFNGTGCDCAAPDCYLWFQVGNVQRVDMGIAVSGQEE